MNERIFYNDGKDKFTQEDIFTITEPLYRYIDDLHSGDYDKDGDIDFLFTYSNRTGSTGNGTVALLVNDGSYDFDDYTIVANLTTTIEMARINPKISTADYDNDGDIDFLVGDNSGLVSFYTNDGTGNFIWICDSDFGYKKGMSWGVSGADFDNDGDIDFIVSIKNSITPGDEGYIYLKFNDGSSSCFDHSDFIKIADLPPRASFFTGVIQPFGCLFSMDYNDDGLMDFFFSGGDSIFLYVQKGTGVFECFTVCRLPSPKAEGKIGHWYSEDMRSGGIAKGDFDGDNIEDLVIGGVQGTVRILYNKQVFVDIVNPDKAFLFINGEINFQYGLLSPIIIYSFLKKGTSIVIGNITVKAKELVPLLRVDFYLNGRLVFTDDASPYEWNWNVFSLGRYKVKAVAYDLDGNNVGFDDAIVWKFL